MITISSPGSSVRQNACTRLKLIVVMLGPKMTSSGFAPRKSAAATRVESTSSVVSSLVTNAPSMFAFECRR